MVKAGEEISEAPSQCDRQTQPFESGENIIKYVHAISGVQSYLPPATKLWQGNVFTGVCDSVHRGEGGLCQGDPPGQRPPSDRDPRTETPPGQRPTPGQRPPNRDPPLDRDPPKHRPHRQRPPWKETLPDRDPLERDHPRQRAPRMVMSSWYTSYWNAFL